MPAEFIFPLLCDIPEHNPRDPETRCMTYPMMLGDTPKSRHWALESSKRRLSLDKITCPECHRLLRISDNIDDIVIR